MLYKKILISSSSICIRERIPESCVTCAMRPCGKKLVLIVIPGKRGISISNLYSMCTTTDRKLYYTSHVTEKT